MNSYTKENSKIIDSWKRKYHLPWMEPITHEEFLNAKNGNFNLKLTPLKSVPKNWIGDIRGKKILGLAAGGGQQMAILSALGANCTLLDISSEQLKNDVLVSKRENYAINIIQADMTQPLPFKEEEFDMVIHPVSNHYVLEVNPIFKEIYRVTKKGGCLLGGFDTGIYWAFDENEEKIVRSLPTNPLKDPKLYQEYQNNDMGIQFSHTLEEQIGGQLKAGFVLVDLYEDMNPEGNLAEHHIPTFIATKSIKL